MALAALLQLCACARLPHLLQHSHVAWSSHLEGGGQQAPPATAGAASAAAASSLAPSSCQQPGGGFFACTLAGGWCPPHDLAITQRVVHSISSSISSSIGSSGPDAPEPPAAHKALLPLSRGDALGLAAASLALLLAASGGIGGGAILVPLYLMVLGEGQQGSLIRVAERPACPCIGSS